MDLLEDSTQSFVVKIWVEKEATEAEREVWYGHITHVPSGEEFHFEGLDKIEAFMKPYLERAGVKPKVGRFRRLWKSRRPGEPWSPAQIQVMSKEA